MMTDLSPQAQAVLDAFICCPVEISDQLALAAALRVVANDWRVDTEFIGGVEYIRTTTLDAIANELGNV